MRDPRLSAVTISGVDVTRDLSLAKVYYTVMPEQHTVEEAQKALEKASGFLRHALGERMIIRNVPQLRFIYDETLVKGTELANLIDQAVAADRKKHQDSD